MSSCFDVIIIGAGASGLRVGIEILKQYPTLHCCILEKYNYVGGRVVTYRKDLPSIGKVQWENGAGRISKNHRRVRDLIRQYRLHFVPISGETVFLDRHTKQITPNAFYSLHNLYLSPLRTLSNELLANHTIVELLEKTIGHDKTMEFVEQFPYYSETHLLRADLALDAFDQEMGSNEGFGVCVEGYQSITDHMHQEFIKLGGTLLQNTNVIEVKRLGEHSMEVLALEKPCSPSKQEHKRVFEANVVVGALHAVALKSIKGIRLPMLRHLTMPPLLRIYAVFPKQHGKVWFHDLPKIVTNSPLRFIIPYDVKKGVIMISYTEGPDATYWMKMSPKDLEHRIYADIQRLFPDRIIPAPLFLKTHPWTDGCTYWKPGHYDPIETSKQSLHPHPMEMPSLFLCSESFSIHQSWVESALEQADKLLALPAFQQAIKP
jgi:hypothetical protein